MENKINFNQVLFSINGKPFKKEGDQDLTLKDVALESVMASTEETQKLSGSEKFKRYQIGLKLNKDEQLSIEELAVIKEMIGKVYSIAVVGAAYSALEG